MPQNSHQPLLEVRDLWVSANGVEILKGINLAVYSGQVHAIMGPNGSGKSTLALALAGHPGYTVTRGQAFFLGQELLSMKTEERALAGLFLSFQHPVEVPGVRLDHFLRAALNATRKSRAQRELDPLRFDRLLNQKLKVVEMDPALVKRSVNEGFSGGEKKRAEVLQMAVLEPRLAILDEPDSGLDVDALRSVAQGIDTLRKPDNALVLVTHYTRILNYVAPDFVHVLIEGRFAKSGDKELAHEIEARGYDWLEADAAASRLSA